MRTKQTLQGIMKHLDHEQVAGVREEPRISEQQFGNFQCVASVLDAKKERKQVPMCIYLKRKHTHSYLMYFVFAMYASHLSHTRQNVSYLIPLFPPCMFSLVVFIIVFQMVKLVLMFIQE